MKILVISFLPPTVGGIASWGGILRSAGAYGDHVFRFVEVPASGSPRGLAWAKKMARSVRLILRVWTSISSEKPGAVHVNCCLSPLGIWRDLVMAVLARLRGLPVVVHYHGSLPDVLARASAITEWGLSKLARSASINIGITRGSVALLDRVTGGKAVFIANFIEDDMVDAPRSQAVRPRPAAVYVGECSVDKGTLDLLDAARRVPGMDFLVVGGAKPGVRDALSAAPANVTHVGPVPRNAVLDFLRNGDLFVFPSRREGFPIAVLEAMAAGLPVVCTRVGALGEVVDEGLGGRFVTPGDVSGLAHELQILAASPELRTRMGTWNRRTCAEKYLFTTIAAELCALYDRLTPATARRIDAALAASPPRRGNEGRLRGRAL